jgi:hypothetical protein
MKYLDSIITIIKKVLRPSWVLILLFLLLLGVEAYILYSKVYGNLFTGINEEIVVENKIVRLDLNNYNKTLELLDGLQAYSAPELNINNPFK